jgi:hypothetical protein
MQQLSAALDKMNKNSCEHKSARFDPERVPPDVPLPQPLLLKEAAGCALRLADILALIGTAALPLNKNQVLKNIHYNYF